MARTPFKKSIKNSYNKFINYAFISAILTAVLGLVMLFLPSLTTKVIGIFAGVSCIASAGSALFNYLKRDGAKLFQFSIFFAISYMVLGALLIVYPYSAMTFVTICLGIYMIIKGLVKVDYGFWFKRGNEDCWLVTLATGILFIIIGILMLVNPFGSALKINQLVGAFLIIIGILDFQNTFMFKKRTKEIIDIFW